MGLFNRKNKVREGLFTAMANKVQEFSKASYTHVEESLKGLVQEQKVVTPAELGEEHPFDFAQIDNLCLRFGLIGAIVDKHVDFMFSGGMNVKSEDERSQKIIEDWMQEMNFLTLARPWVTEAFKKGTGFLELGENKQGIIDAAKNLKADFMYIKQSETGEIEKVNQFTRPMDMFKKSQKEVIVFEPDEIAILALNRQGDSPYGIGIVYPALSVINDVIGSRKEMMTMMKRKANSPLFFIAGDREKDIVPTEGEMNNLGARLEWLNNKHEWVLNDYIRPMTLDFGNVGDKFSFIIENSLEVLYSIVQIPAVLMGKANVPEGLAQEQRYAFDLRIQSYREEVEKVIEEKIFKRILKAHKLDTHVEIVWGLPTQQEKNEKITQMTQLLTNPFLNPALKDGLEKQLAILYDIPEGDLDDGKEERDKEEDQKLPLVPTQRQREPSVNPPANESIEENFEFHDVKVGEWVNFNYSQYTQDILEVLDNDDFTDMRGFTKTELKAGMLNAAQIEKVRQTLREGFEENLTIRQIQDRLNKRIAFKDRYRMQDGKIVMNEDKPVVAVRADKRANMVARTETIRISNEGAKLNYSNNGIEKVRWISAISSRTCKLCSNMNGQIFPINNVPTNRHVDCRCTISPVVE